MTGYPGLVAAAVPNICRPPAPGLPIGPRMLVFGCARSGTTLLVNLLRTFDRVRVHGSEHCASDLFDDPYPGWVALKRTAHCAEHLVTDLPSLRRAVWILDIVRDPRDVVTSVLEPFPGYYCGYDRWDRDLRVSEHLAGQHRRYLRIRYEELVLRPDEVQRDLADVLGLSIQSRFSDFPAPMPGALPAAAVQALGGVRRLDAGGVGRWRQDEHHARVSQQLAAHPRMEETLRWMGYPPTDLGASIHHLSEGTVTPE